MLALQTLLLSTALLLALLLNLALKPSFSAKLNTAALSLAVLGGLVFYSVGFAEATGNLIISVVRTPYAVLRMFLGLNDLPTIEKTSLLSTNAGLVCFWVLHMLAFYSITSAVMTTLGAELLRTLRFFLSHRGDLTLIYGISPDSIALGKECLRDKAAVVFIADKPENADSSVIQDLNNQGMAAATGLSAVQSEKRFLRKLHLKKRKITVYAMAGDEDQNLYYALRLRSALEELGVPAENTQISLPGEEEIIASMLQTSEQQYGFGYVNVYKPEDLTARALSLEFYRFIENHLSTLKLIAVCTGDDAMNSEISDRLMLFLRHRQAEQICVVQCGENGVRYQKEIGSPIIRTDIRTRAFLSAEDADRGAIILNASYDPSPRSDWEKWVSCDSFSKMSSRASADFFPAFLRAANVSRETVLSEGWNLTDEQLRNLGETEHLRWCAFHYTMGYSVMGREQFEKNARKWAQCQKEGVPCPVKISKDARSRRHACLVPWEELDELSGRENELTGRNTDYQQMDINNVLAVPKLLQREAEKQKNGHVKNPALQ